MGRGKIDIKRLEPASHRNSTFRNRFKGLCKKAEELSVLCDVPVMLVVSEPNDRQKLCLNGNRTFEQIVQQFANESKESLEKENKHCIEVLEGAYKNDDHVVDVRSLMHNGVRRAKEDETFEGKKELEMIEEEIVKIENHVSPLRDVGGLEKINTILELEDLEKSLIELFSLNERRKALLLEIQKNGLHGLPTPYEGDHPVSTSPLAQQTEGPSEILCTEQQNTMCHVPLQYEGDPGCSTSRAAAPVLPIGPLPSSPFSPLYGRDPRCSISMVAAPEVLTAPSRSKHIAPLYDWNMIETANVTVWASSLNPQNGDLPEEEYPQNGGLPEEAGSEEYFQNGILREEAGSEEYPQNGDLPDEAWSEEYLQNGDLSEEAGLEYPQNGYLPVEAGSEYPQNGYLLVEAGLEYPQNSDLPEEAGSEEYPQNGDLREEVGSEEYMQRKYDDEISSIINLHLHSPTHEDYSLFF